jgi:Tfp pilus assembly protein PilN
MNEIDLIPRSYRDMVRLRRILRTGLVALSAVCLVGALLIGWLRWQLHAETSELASVRREAASTAALLAQVRALNEQKMRLDHTEATLAVLRGGGDILAVATAIDTALNPAVWLTSFSFIRNSEPPEAARDAVPGPGPQPRTATAATSPVSNGGVVRRASSSIEIRGGALDYRALADFMRALSAQPSTSDVRFIQSNASGEAGMEAVEFSASAALVPAKKDMR